MYTKDDFQEVDLEYSFFTSDDKESFFIKFTGFEDEEQLDSFAEYIEKHLPLLLFNSSTKN